MWISTRGQYGLRALIELAARIGEPASIASIAAAQNISEAYLEQILGALRRVGFVRSTRGAFGGYELARAPEDITALDVILVLEGDVVSVDCSDEERVCARGESCGVHRLWQRVDAVVRENLSASTVADLLMEARLQNELSRLREGQTVVS
jgi:Rrf2 family transcriptional regulator, cysteine metabolism repressor